MPHTLLWTPDPETGAYDATMVLESTHYRRMLHAMGGDLAKIDALARELTEAVRETPFSRYKLFVGAGSPVRRRLEELNEVLREQVTGKVEWRVIGANTGVFERGGFWARVAAVVSVIEPTIWIRFTFVE